MHSRETATVSAAYDSPASCAVDSAGGLKTEGRPCQAHCEPEPRAGRLRERVAGRGDRHGESLSCSELRSRPMLDYYKVTAHFENRELPRNLEISAVTWRSERSAIATVMCAMRRESCDAARGRARSLSRGRGDRHSESTPCSIIAGPTKNFVLCSAIVRMHTGTAGLSRQLVALEQARLLIAISQKRHDTAACRLFAGSRITADDGTLGV